MLSECFIHRLLLSGACCVVGYVLSFSLAPNRGRLVEISVVGRLSLPLRDYSCRIELERILEFHRAKSRSLLLSMY